jgi:hypothetical protein
MLKNVTWLHKLFLCGGQPLWAIDFPWHSAAILVISGGSGQWESQITKLKGILQGLDGGRSLLSN